MSDQLPPVFEQGFTPWTASERAAEQAHDDEFTALRARVGELERALVPAQGNGACDYCRGVGACPKCWGRSAIVEITGVLEETQQRLAAATKRAEEAEGRAAHIAAVTASGHRGCTKDHTNRAADDFTACWICKEESVRSLLGRAAEMIHAAITDGETVYPDDARALLAEMREKEGK